jgi:hypothetical protein
MSTLVTTNLKNEASASNNIVLNADGTVSLSGAFSGDIDFDSGTLYVDATNNRVGLGSSSPLSRLHVQNTSSNDGVRVISSTTGEGFLIFGDTDDANTGAVVYNHSNDSLRFEVDNATAVTIDSSQRLLVGTTSSTASTTLLVQGFSADATAQGIITLARGTNAPADGGSLGNIVFSDNGHSVAAAIYGRRDGGTWTSGSSQPTRLEFLTTADGASSPTERMRIGNDGSTRTFASATTLALSTAAAAGTTIGLLWGRHSATAVNTGTTCFYVYSNGDIQNTNNSYGQITSDERFKQDIVDAPSQWDDIKAVRLAKYRWKSDPTGDLLLGPIAQELQAVSPGLVDTRIATAEDVPASGGLVAEGDEVLGFKASILYMKAVGALQEAMERIETLEQRLSDAGIA